MNKPEYFNFPVTLLDGFLTDSTKVLKNILYYALYHHSLKLEFGDDLELITSSAEFFSVKLGNEHECLKIGEKLYHDYKDSPKCGLNIATFWDFYKNQKSEFEKVSLLGFLAIKSILGRKTYCKIDNKFWLSRMSGKAKSMDISELDPNIQKYNSEYQTKKIKNELKQNWGLKTYSRYTRGFYVSFQMSLEDLIYQAEKRRKSTKEKQSKLEEKVILNKVLAKLNNPERGI
ncbi:hypothetical protein [Chryseobacterium sp. SIMBA_038]|uniref:hypothetical protein n=1 Tax=Chryseobacterium sp. SIMBA_038 TaxID=3085780 RepID=UPI003978B13A